MRFRMTRSGFALRNVPANEEGFEIAFGSFMQLPLASSSFTQRRGYLTGRTSASKRNGMEEIYISVCLQHLLTNRRSALFPQLILPRSHCVPETPKAWRAHPSRPAASRRGRPGGTPGEAASGRRSARTQKPSRTGRDAGSAPS